MKKILQIMQACDGWEAVFFSYDDGEVFCEPVVCWALVSERPYVENGEDEERYIEGQVLVEKGSDIGGVYDLPENIGFLGYLNTKLPEKNRKEQTGFSGIHSCLGWDERHMFNLCDPGNLLLDLNLSSLTQSTSSRIAIFSFKRECR